MAGGQVEWVFGEMESDAAAEGETDPQGNGYLSFDNGVRAFIRATPTGVAAWEIDVIGTEGRIRSLANCTQMEYIRTAAGGNRGRGVPAYVPFPYPTHIQGMGLTIIEDLIQAIETGSDPRCSGDDGRAALEVAIALRQSHRDGFVRVELPLADRSLGILSSEISQDHTPARVRRLQAS